MSYPTRAEGLVNMYMNVTEQTYIYIYIYLKKKYMYTVKSINIWFNKQIYC